MLQKYQRFALLATVLVIVAALVACGGDDDDDDASDPTAAGEGSEATVSPTADDGSSSDDATSGDVVDAGTVTVGDDTWTFDSVSCSFAGNVTTVELSPSSDGAATIEVRSESSLVEIRAADSSYSWFTDEFYEGGVTITAADGIVSISGTVVNQFSGSLPHPEAPIEAELVC